MTLQRVKAYSTLKVAVGGNFPDDLKTKKMDQNCIFQSIWVNSLSLTQLVTNRSTMRTGQRVVTMHAPGV